MIAITPRDIRFDPRAILKCKWGCDWFEGNIKCSSRDLSYKEKVKIIQKYSRILLLHANDNQKLYKACLAIEKKAFLSGHYLASTIKACGY